MKKLKCDFYDEHLHNSFNVMDALQNAGTIGGGIAGSGPPENLSGSTAALPADRNHAPVDYGVAGLPEPSRSSTTRPALNAPNVSNPPEGQRTVTS